MSDQAKVTLSGKIKTIFPAEVYGNFEKRVMWLEETVDRYPQTYSIEFHQGDCNVLDAFKEGDEVQCSINLRGRHWQKDDKEGVMNTFQCWRIKKVSPAAGTPATDPGKEYQQAEAVHHGTAPAAEVADELPF
jgi:hypothetical protein